MHTLNGGLVVQTFALAKNNESEGRKARIRRSKKERKAMVESFIKQYQSSNNGNFPSLNLTHKEVGGSFYTVREIVREIIQENRVLGPAKFSPEELSYQQDEQDPLGSIAIEPSTPLYVTSNESHFVPNHHQAASEDTISISDGLCSESENQKFSPEELSYQQDEQDPLGSIAIEPSTPLYITSNESHFVPNHHQAASEDTISISDGLCSESENQKFDNDRIVNGYQVDVTIEESGKQTSEDLQTSEQLEMEKNSAASADNATSITEDIVVETFPLRPVSSIVDGLDTTSGARNLTETFEESETEKVNVEQGNGSASSGQINSSSNSNLVDERKTDSLTAVVLDRNSDLVDSKVVENFTDSQLKSSNNFTTGGSVSDTHVDAEVEIEVSNNGVLTSEINEQSQKADGSKAIKAPNSNSPSNDTYASSSRGQVRTPEGIVTENETNVQGEGNSHEGSNPTLDRINLESWDGASRKSDGTETNPILAIFKSFVTAFIKFWSE